MKKHISELLGLFFILVSAANVLLVVFSLKVSIDIHEFEQKTHAIAQENLVLEKKLADDISFSSLAVYEKKWGFVHAQKPVYIGELQYALKSTR